MLGSTAFYAGLVICLAGCVLAGTAITRMGATRPRALAAAASGALLAVAALAAPSTESRATRLSNRLDRFSPAWQFREVHIRWVNAPPARVFDAIRTVRADEILLFRTLTWLRRGGRPSSPDILNPGTEEPIITVATKGGFVILADEAPRELVLGAIVVAPPWPREKTTAAFFERPAPPGYAVAAMNFLVAPDGPDASIVSTETRVFASGPKARRRFAVYWRVIYPGSATIRRMWLRAIERRATS